MPKADGFAKSSLWSEGSQRSKRAQRDLGGILMGFGTKTYEHVSASRAYLLF